MSKGNTVFWKQDMPGSIQSDPKVIAYLKFQADCCQGSAMFTIRHDGKAITFDYEEDAEAFRQSFPFQVV